MSGWRWPIQIRRRTAPFVGYRPVLRYRYAIYHNRALPLTLVRDLAWSIGFGHFVEQSLHRSGTCRIAFYPTDLPVPSSPVPILLQKGIVIRTGVHVRCQRRIQQMFDTRLDDKAIKGLLGSEVVVVWSPHMTLIDCESEQIIPHIIAEAGVRWIDRVNIGLGHKPSTETILVQAIHVTPADDGLQNTVHLGPVVRISKRGNPPLTPIDWNDDHLLNRHDILPLRSSSASEAFIENTSEGCSQPAVNVYPL